MSGRIGVDFGTSNTVVAAWDEHAKDTSLLRLPGYSTSSAAYGAVPAIPSLISYGDGGERWIGEQVVDRSLVGSSSTFRWMKRYISQRVPTARVIGGAPKTALDAGTDFFSAILAAVAAEATVGEDEVALTVPVEAFEDYEDWLTDTAALAGIRRLRLIDEASAAALGYGTSIQPNDVYLVFDFGGGTLDVSVVIIEESTAKGSGRRCRVLGKSGADIGGASIDTWILDHVVRASGREPHDDDVRRIGNALLVECELAKIRLSSHEAATVTAIDTETGRVIGAEISRVQFEELLDAHDAYSEVDKTIRKAIGRATEKGYTEEGIKAVLMLGGSSLIPSIQKTVRQIFGREKVRLERPLDAVARGAAAFVSGIDFFDHIQHDYSIQYVDPSTGEYAYRMIVPRGTDYPTAQPVRVTISGTYDGQKEMGIAIYELSDKGGSKHGSIELAFDERGAARLNTVSVADSDRRREFWMNEEAPTFLHADPPVREGEQRFEVAFAVDANKRLLMTARDLQKGVFTHRDFPVVKLT